MAKTPAVALAPGVWRIPLLGDFVNGFILRDDDGQVTLVDMGVKQSGPKVLAALASIGSGPSDVTRLMLTHAHPDHAGGAAHVARATGRTSASTRTTPRSPRQARRRRATTRSCWAG